MTITENQRLRNRAFGVILFLAAALLQEQGNAQDSCASNLSGLTNISFSTSSLRCIKAWPQYNYILRHSVDNSTKIVSIVFSSDIDDSYHAIGFSRNGKMVPSSAIVGWSSNKIPVIKAYSLQGQSPDLVLPDSTMLKLVKGSPKAFIQNGALYLTFQVQLDQLSTHLIYAIGPLNTLPGSGYKLQEHRDFLSTKFDFTTGVLQKQIDTLFCSLKHSMLDVYVRKDDMFIIRSRCLWNKVQTLKREKIYRYWFCIIYCKCEKEPWSCEHCRVGYSASSWSNHSPVLQKV
ncbi:hypothetical protein O6H91_05G114200 [Diphasiastrum complanatum]|uniref:Uncharacterized protein n=1 Tax=Diphasiastrum complanatum TaxID=34168 RepID=A0ACC2DSS6_DIPCM|nr:hypothetical protein O6H91_05G114200 [Diphasiastrum complanatum]